MVRISLTRVGRAGGAGTVADNDEHKRIRVAAWDGIPERLRHVRADGCPVGICN